MILRQLADGPLRGREPVQARRPLRGQPARARGDGRGLRAAAALRVARPRASSPRARLRLSDAYADLDAELRYAVPGVRVADPKACQCGEVLKGVIKPWECKVFGTACTPERADRHLHGLARGRLRRLLQLRPLRPRAGGRVTRRATAVSDREQRILEIIETRARQARRGSRTTQHHDGPRRRRQGDPDPDRGPASCPAFGVDRARRAGRRRRARGRRRRARDDDRQLRRQADPLPRRLDRRAGGQRHRQRPRRRRRPAARAHASRWCSRRASPPTTCAPRSRRSPRAAAAAGVEVVAGDTKVVERGHADCDVRLHHRRRPRRPAGARSRPPALRPGRPDPRLRARSATTARRSCWRAASSSSTPTIESDTRSLWPAVDALLDAAGPGAALHARRDPRRRRLGAQRAGARVGRGDGRARGRRARSSPAVRGRGARSSGSTRCTWPTRASWSPSSRPRRPTRRWPRCARCPGCERRRGDRRGEDRAARDGAGGDGVRRQAGDGPARRRPAAADLLSREEERDGDRRVRTGSARDGGGHRARDLDDDGAQLRRRLGRDDLGDEPEPRGHHPRASSRACRRWSSTTRCSPTRTAPSSCRPGTTPRPASSTRSCWSSRARSPTRRSTARATGPGWATTPRPASRSPPTSGSTAWRRRRRRWSRSAPAPPTAASRR